MSTVTYKSAIEAPEVNKIKIQKRKEKEKKD